MVGRARRRACLRQQMVIKGVQRLARFQHHVIGHIHHVADAADADLFQGALQPIRAGGDLHAANHAGRVTRAQLRIFDPHRHQLFDAAAGFGELDLRQLQRVAGHGADLARDADDAVQVGPVRRDFQVIDHVAAGPAEILGERLADLGVLAQDEQPLHLVPQAEFLRRTHHAVRFDAANLADLDGEGRLARLGGQAVARQDERHLVAGLEVLRAADDLALALAVVDPADGELVGVGVLVLGDDLGDDDAVEFAAELLDAFDLDAEHRQPLGQFGSATSRTRRIA